MRYIQIIKDSIISLLVGLFFIIGSLLYYLLSKEAADQMIEEIARVVSNKLKEDKDFQIRINKNEKT